MKTRHAFDRYLPVIEDALRGQPEPNDPPSLYEPQRYTLGLGGKRIRPMLTMMGAGLCGGDPNHAVPAAVCVEMTHTFTLIHDDIMDSAETRRGQPTVFNAWGIPAAILAGDSLFVQAMRHLLAYGGTLSSEELAMLFKAYFDGVDRVCEGQALDMEFAGRRDVTHEDYLRMIDGKTAALLRTSLQLGGIVSHATGGQLEDLAAIGTSLGLAFQIQDDLLDATADFAKLGKTIGGDILEGKVTYLVSLSRSLFNRDDLETLDAIMEKPIRDENDVRRVLELFHAYDVIASTRQTVSRHYRSAIEHLHHFSDSTYRKDLADLIDFLQHREH